MSVNMTNHLYAISDIHLSNKQNLTYFSTLTSQKDFFPANSGLILAGDVGETPANLRSALEISLKVFKYVWWVPGNHELYTVSAPASSTSESNSQQHESDAAINNLRGEERYKAFVNICREYSNVYTPEDEWVIWDTNAEEPLISPSQSSNTASAISTSTDTTSPTNPNESRYSPTNPDSQLPLSRALICPFFTLYDYTFRPAHLTTTASALAWSQEANIYATDEALLHPDPYANKESWCASLVSRFHAKLTTARSQHPDLPFILINHWPLTQAVLHIPSIPRFSLWCGTVHTETWTEEFAPVAVVVSGHLHVRRTDWIDGTRWEEVSLGYPRQWAAAREQEIEVQEMVREIMPGPGEGERLAVRGATRWRKFGGR